jgi:hypothetical protein
MDLDAPAPKPAALGDNVQDIVLSTLRAVCADANAPAAAKAQAARTLAEIAGLVGRHAAPPDQGERRPSGTMSRAEIQAELARLRENRSTT